VERISSNLSDPAWWFTAVFVAIAAGVIASFARDWLSLWMARRKERFRNRRRSELRKQARLIQECRRSLRLYISLTVFILWDFIATLFVVVYVALIAPLYSFYKSHPEYDPLWSLAGLPRGNEIVPNVLSFMFFVAMFGFYYRLVQKIRLYRRVQYEERRTLASKSR
jgi:hypothetical protein